MKDKVGRPKLPENKRRSYQYRLRLNQSDKDLLDLLSEKTGNDKSEILRYGLMLYASSFEEIHREVEDESHRSSG